MNKSSKEVTMYRSDDGKLHATQAQMEMVDDQIRFKEEATKWAAESKKPESSKRHINAITAFLMWRRAQERYSVLDVEMPE